MNRFEDAVHTTRRDEGELSTEKFEELWLDCQTKLFGDSVDIDGYGDVVELHLALHRARPGYVYAYSYGFLFALSIFRKYELEGDVDGRAVPRRSARRWLEAARGARARWSASTSPIRGSGRAGIDALAVELDEAEALAADIGLRLRTPDERRVKIWRPQPRRRYARG